MPVTKKPQLTEKADDFIEGAKADNVKPQKSDADNTVKINDGEPQKSSNVNTEKADNIKTSNKKTKMTFYMTSEMYLKWKEFELGQLRSGKKVTFQGVVEKYLKKILK